MFSTRFAAPVIAILALAAIPTVIHSYRDSTIDDGRTTREIPMRLADTAGAPTTRRANWGQDRFSSTDWIERQYSGVRLFVGRSFDPKKLYHHPELAVDYGNSYAAASVVRLPKRPDVPVYVLRASGGDKTRIALYALNYDGRYVDDPIRFQLRTSWQLLFSRRRAMTLFFAVEERPTSNAIESSRAAAVLLAAMEAFEKQRQ